MFTIDDSTDMSATEYLRVQDELSAVRSRLEGVVQALTSQSEEEARSPVLLAMDSIDLAKDFLCEAHRTSTNGGGKYNNARDCFRIARSSGET